MKQDKYVLFGAGELGRDYFNSGEIEKSKILFFVDNDVTKHGTDYGGKMIFSPSKLKDIDLETTILIAVKAHTAIKEQLQKIGINHNIALIPDLKIENLFNKIYEENHWGGENSVSGRGSDLDQTQILVKEIPKIIEKFNIKNIIDAPCGDLNWLSSIPLDLEWYMGVDIVGKLIEQNNLNFGDNIRSFNVMNIIEDILPKTDLILTRDALVHFSKEDILKTISNFKKSGSKYLLTTTFTDVKENKNIGTGGWRPVNLEIEPFNFPKPIFLLNEGCAEENGKYKDKSLGLWEIESLKF